MFVHRAQRTEDGRLRRVMTGIRPLDEMLLGFCERDLVLLGARTGVGKTQLATAIAVNLALRGSRTLFIALEAHHREMEDRAW